MNLPPCCSRRLLSLSGLGPFSLPRRAIVTCDLASSQPSCSRSYSSLRKAAPTKHNHRILPRLSPDFLLSFGPHTNSRQPSDSSPRQRAQLISRLLSLLEQRSSSADAIFAAYLEVLSLPSGETLLSPQEVSRVIQKLIPQKRRVGIATRTAFERVTLILEGVTRARDTLLQSSSRSQEAVEWEALLRSPRLRNDMVRLIRDSHRTPGTDELHQVLDVLRKGFQWEAERSGMEAGNGSVTGQTRRRQARSHRQTASTDRINHNMVLDLISRIAQQPTLRNAGRNSEQTFANEATTSRMVQELPLKRLVTSALPREDTSSSLEDMSQLYYTLWNDMNAFDGLGADAFAWSTRLRLEGKVMFQECFAALSEIRSDRALRSLDEVWDKSLTFKGWINIQTSLKKALAAGALHSSHVHQVLWFYCHLRLAARRATAKSGESVLSAVMNRFLGFDADAVDAVSELYETLRWNEVQMEMNKLRTSRSNGGGKSPPPSPFGSILAGLRSAGEEPASNPSHGPVVTLLGIPIPDQMVPSDITYSMLIRYYAAVEGDYAKACEVLEDFKQAGPESGPVSPTSTSTPPARQPPMAILDSFFRAFAVHGVASEEGEDGQWYVADSSPLASTAGPVPGWRLENLLSFLDALLYRTAPKLENRRAEQVRYERISAMLSADSLGAGEDDEVLQALLFPTSASVSTSTSDVRPEASASTSAPTSYQAQAPTPRQLFTVLTALRRCTGDARPDLVLRYWHALEAKYGFPDDGQRTGVRVEVEGKAEVEENANTKLVAEIVRAVDEAVPLAPAEDAASQQPHREAEQSVKPEHQRDSQREAQRAGTGERQGEVAGAEDSSVQHTLERANGEGWTGWRLDNRLKRLLPFLEEQAGRVRRERGEDVHSEREGEREWERDRGRGEHDLR